MILNVVTNVAIRDAWKIMMIFRVPCRKDIWMFPKMKLPQNYPFHCRIFHEKKTSSYWGAPMTREPPHQNHLRNRHLTITWNNACSFGSRSNRIRDIPPKHGNATRNGEERDVAWLHQTPKMLLIFCIINDCY